MDIKEIGEVVSVRKNIAWIKGFYSCMSGQTIDFQGGIAGMVMGFTSRLVMTLILGNELKVRVGDKVSSHPEMFLIPVGDAFLGRMVDALAEPFDCKEPIIASEAVPILGKMAETMDRVPANDFFQVGTMIVDSMVPLAKGQRQLVVGDRMTGKTTLAMDTILNQKGKGVVCIYCCIGKSYSSLIKAIQLLKKNDAMDYTIIVAATAAMPVGQQFLVPFTAATLGEYFMKKGGEVLVVFDDMTKHSWVYRQISLLLERPPGREAYPGDIFYLHAQLLERAGKLPPESGGGSMTFLPIVDTLYGDLTGLVPSNLISMVDGQIYLSSELFREGFKPAIDFFQSVSIIGSVVQPPLLKRKSSALRFEYAQYRNLLRLAKLKTTFSEEASAKIKRGQAIVGLLKQEKHLPLSYEEEVACLYALSSGKLDALPAEKLYLFKKKLRSVLSQAPGLVNRLKSETDLTQETERELDQCLQSLF